MKFWKYNEAQYSLMSTSRTHNDYIVVYDSEWFVLYLEEQRCNVITASPSLSTNAQLLKICLLVDPRGTRMV